MKKLDKAKVKKFMNVSQTIFLVMCYLCSLHTQVVDHNTTEALCWLILGTLMGAITVEVN